MKVSLSKNNLLTLLFESFVKNDFVLEMADAFFHFRYFSKGAGRGGKIEKCHV